MNLREQEELHQRIHKLEWWEQAYLYGYCNVLEWEGDSRAEYEVEIKPNPQKAQVVAKQLTTLRSQVDHRYEQYRQEKIARGKAAYQAWLQHSKAESQQRVQEAVQQFRQNPFYHPKLRSQAEWNEFNRMINPNLWKKSK